MSGACRPRIPRPGLRSVLLALLVAGPGWAGGAAEPTSAVLDPAEALAVSQKVVGRRLGSHRLLDREARPFDLETLRGRPLVISPVYTSCAHTCPMLTKHLAGIVGIAREALGEDSFNVVTVGFDSPTDDPQRMKSFAAERRIDAPHWWFLSGSPSAVGALMADLGFVYVSSAGGFDHLAQTTVIDAEGRVYRQVYGQTFEAPQLVEPLKELVFGRRVAASSVDGWLNGVRLLCTVYDPASGRYRFDYSLVVGTVIGALSLGAVAVFIVRAWRHSGRVRRRASAPVQGRGVS